MFDTYTQDLGWFLIPSTLDWFRESISIYRAICVLIVQAYENDNRPVVSLDCYF
jgi:hypothetical protein